MWGAKSAEDERKLKKNKVHYSSGTYTKANMSALRSGFSFPESEIMLSGIKDRQKNTGCWKSTPPRDSGIEEGYLWGP